MAVRTVCSGVRGFAPLSLLPARLPESPDIRHSPSLLMAASADEGMGGGPETE